MKKRNKFIVIGIIVLVMVIITGIWYNTSHQKDGTIKIGATLALSGKYTYIGQQELNGLIMAAEEINNNEFIDIIIINAFNKKKQIKHKRADNLIAINILFSCFIQNLIQ